MMKRMIPARCLAMLLMLAMLTTVVGAAASPLAEATMRPVRVGFFAFDGYHMVDEDGLRSGYGYDFIQMASRYANWSLSYVGYENSWADMLTMLEDGEVDIVTSAQKTPEREEMFAFSTKAIGTSSAVLTCRAYDGRYITGDATTYAGMRIGLLRGSSRNQAFNSLAAEREFVYEPVMYDDTSDMVSDLHNGVIDGIVTSSLRSMNNERVLEEFAPSDFYAIVRKDDAALLDEINFAIEQLDINSPGWRTQLDDRYYTPQTGASMSFTQSERNFLLDMQRNGAVLRVCSNPDLAPYSWEQDGEPQGIVPEIFRELASRVGIQWVYVPSKDYAGYHELAVSGEIDVDLTCFCSYGMAEQFGLRLTDSYMTTVVARVTQAKFNQSVTRVAGLRDGMSMTGYGTRLMGDAVRDEYDSMAECVAAVADGRDDALYAYAYTAQKAITDDARNRLTMTLLPEYSVDLSIGVNVQLDYRLLSILNKGVCSIRTAYAEQVVQQEMAKVTRSDTLLNWVYDHPEMAVALVTLVLVLLFALAAVLLRLRSVRIKRAQTRELARFVGYVCEINDLVLEVNLNTMQAVHHYMQEGVLKSEIEPYRFAHYQNEQDAISQDDFSSITKTLTESSMREMIRVGGERYFEAKVKGADGVYRWYAYTVRGIPRDKLHPNNFILFKRDIDKKKRQEEEQRRTLEDALENARVASQAKGQFLSRMSHEIRTPLNAVIGYMDIAKDSADNPEKMMHCVENSDLAARHLLNIINDVLDISAIESGKMKIAHEDFDLRKQITTLSTIFFNQAKAKQVVFDVALHDLTEEWVVGDSLRLNQILMNLLSNAVKFTPAEGRITLSVTQMNVNDHRVFLKFEVSDTGIGMSEAYQKRLFRPFEQESATTAQKYGGSGLGLSITGNLVSMMGGTIDVHSKQGEGTTFVVSLYFDRSSHQQEEEGTPQDYSRLRALVVDDEQSSCDYIKSLLKRCGVKSDAVLSGEAAVKQIKRRAGTDYAYDLCIMDWNMPSMNGIETTRKIREECDPDLPIIIATAYDVTEFEDEAKALKIRKVIAKPVFQSTMFDLLVSTYGKYKPVSKVDDGTALELKGMHILLAEDNVMNAEIAVDVLNRAGIVVDVAGDGRAACDKFLNAPVGTYQAILMDIQMPIMDGYQATHVIRTSDHPEAKSICIVAMTANAFAEDVTAALNSGMNDHVSKPIDYDKLFRALKKHRAQTKA